MGPNRTIDRCPYCSGSLYMLSEGMCKCAACRKKFSPRKLLRELEMIERFCRGETALQSAKAMGIGYAGVTTRYKQLRMLAAGHLEEMYESHRERVREFEEYVYLEASKRHDKRHIFDAHNFITFDYGGQIYNLIMPSLHRFKQPFLEDGLDDLYYEEFSKFLRIHRISKLQKSKNTITEYWAFFEAYITRFKGIDPENFPYYLKETEFKFNYDETTQIALLHELWFRP